MVNVCTPARVHEPVQCNVAGSPQHESMIPSSVDIPDHSLCSCPVAQPGSDENWLRCCTANAMSMRVPLAAYIIELTVVRYGICAISALSLSVVSENDFESITLGSRGIATGWASSRCKCFVIFSMYAFCDRDIVQVAWSHVIAIPSKK